jgi:hypothetical protein
MKNQLIEKLRELLNSEDILSVRDAVRDIRNEWKSESGKERQEQLQAFKAEEHPEETEFVYTPHELEGEYQELNSKYENLIEEANKKLAAERLKNFEEKSALLKEFEALIADEQNISKAFGDHKEIKAKWDAIGEVPAEKYQELNEHWHKLNHEFYYNINIYKSLLEHDLKINQKKKEEMIEVAKGLASIESFSELELLVRKYQREWMDIGPSPRETFKEQGDMFFGLLREAQQRIQAHYDALNANSEENLAKKRVLVNKMQEILGMEITNVSTWHRWTDEVLKLQEEWKCIGWSRKKENEEIWQEFRALCDKFFAGRNAFMDERRASYKEHREKKEALIAKAQEIQNDENWKETTEAFKKLQEEWKHIGSADPREEQKLWQRFRSVCDHFFNRKKQNFAGIVAEQEQNLAVKQDMLKELEALEITGNKNNDLAALREFSDRWHAVGFVPKEHVKAVMDKYNQILDVKYGKINADREEREMGAFRNRLSSMKNTADAETKLRKERGFLREKIDRLKRDIIQYQNNMAIFTGKGAEALRKDIDKKIKNSEREIEDLQKKIEMLNSPEA